MQAFESHSRTLSGARSVVSPLMQYRGEPQLQTLAGRWLFAVDRTNPDQRYLYPVRIRWLCFCALLAFDAPIVATGGWIASTFAGGEKR